MRSVQVYVEGKRLELFKDESISIKSSQQDIADISKVMTDYSQTFSIPASPNNNSIFEHFYETDVNATIDHNLRRNATVEIDGIEFKRGKIVIEKASIENGLADNYSVTFYGETLAIKDKFAEEEIKDIVEANDAPFTFSYTQQNIKTQIQSDSITPVKFPLIVNRVVSYGDDESTDISSTGLGAIHTNELFPALSVSSLFKSIESRYDLDFHGSFLEDDRFKKAYLYCKNGKDFSFMSKPSVNDGTNRTADADNYNEDLDDSIGSYIQFNGGIHLKHQAESELFPNIPVVTTSGGYTVNYDMRDIYHHAFINITNVSNANSTYYVDVFENGNLVRTIEGQGSSQNAINSGVYYGNSNLSLDSVFTFLFRADSFLTLDAEIVNRQTITLADSSLGGVNDGGFQNPDFALTLRSFQNNFRANSTVTLSTDLDITQYVPKMKVSDFFKGVLNMFNLTCYGLGSNDGVDSYQIEPIDDWYLKGAIIDVSEYIDTKTIKIDRVPLYKNISFEYQESKSATNEEFRRLFNKGFGNTTSQFEYDGGEFKIKLPFENLMFNRFTDTDLQVGMTLDSSVNSYIPKPIILYMADSRSADFNINTGVHETLSSYVPFGQDATHNNTDVSLNFSADYSTLTGQPSNRNLFSEYYYPYLGNLYNLKNRNTKVKAVLPISILSSIELNDRLIIRNKRFLINSMTTNLTNGEVTLDLLNDFRPVISESGSIGGSSPITIDNTAQCLDINVLFPNNAVSATISCAGSTSLTPTSLTESGVVTVCLPANDGTEGSIITEDGLFTIALEDGSGDDVLQEELGGGSLMIPYLVLITYTMTDGTSLVSGQIIFQNP